jgi:transketolase
MIKKKSLENHITNIKTTFLQMYHQANAGHVGSSLSCAEILGVAWFYLKSEEDRLVLSKGHAAAAFYATLHEAGIISEEEIASFYKNNTVLPAHPPVNKFKEIPFATGSLGHGLSIAAGFGYSNKIKNTNDQVFCVTSDGEINEGSTWEAALFIAHHQLTNVIWIIDRNRFQGFGSTEETILLDPLDKKLEAFGFDVIELNGHSIKELMNIKELIPSTNKPLAVIANTIKGNGWNGKSNTLDSHYLPMKEHEFTELLNTLNHES